MSPRRVDGLETFLDRFGTEAPEVIWTAALAWLERAAHDARNVASSRWRHYPDGEIRRLRGEIAGALMLARLAGALQEEENTRERELVREMRRSAEEQRRQTKLEGTTEATRTNVRTAAKKRRAAGGSA